jgi:glucokinase
LPLSSPPGPGWARPSCTGTANDTIPSPPRGATSITRLGLAGEDPLCVATLQLFSTLYGAEAGNLALKCLATGGGFVGGGIAPKILPVLQDGSFLRGFTDKGRFTDFMKSLEVSVSLNQEAALIGAAHYALRL